MEARCFAFLKDSTGYVTKCLHFREGKKEEILEEEYGEK
jgi:hypothetical protein